MRVKTIKHHINYHGPKSDKGPGVVYDLPENEAATLITDGVVEEVKNDGAKGKH